METYLRSKAFAELIGVKEQTLRAWRVNRSDGPIFIRDGRVILYPVQANLDRLKRLQITSTSQVKSPAK